jgi:hypothetical protein
LTVAKKHTLNRPEGKLALIVGSQVGPTGTSKCAKRIVVRFLAKELMGRIIQINDLAREMID